jgi:hypothetical protein
MSKERHRIRIKRRPYYSPSPKHAFGRNLVGSGVKGGGDVVLALLILTCWLGAGIVVGLIVGPVLACAGDREGTDAALPGSPKSLDNGHHPVARRESRFASF